jgi:hypothetical protein
VVAATSDGSVAFTRSSAAARSLEVLDPTTGNTTVLAARFPTGSKVVVAGRVVALWLEVNGFGVGDLSVWTRATGVSHVGPGSTAGVFAASEDGGQIAYSWNASERKSDLVLGAPKMAVPPKVAVHEALTSTNACEIRLELAHGRLFIASCAEGETSPVIRTVSDSTDVVTILAAAKRQWSIDATASRIFVISSEGIGSIHTLPENISTTIDRDVSWGQLEEDGSSVVYRTAENLKRARTRLPLDAFSFAPAASQDVPAFSPNLRYAMLSSPAAQGEIEGRAVELWPIPPGQPFIPTPTKPTPLVTTRTGRALGFTETEKAIYLSDLPPRGLAVGTLKARAPGAAEVVLAHDVLSPKLTSGDRIVFGDHPRFEGTKLVALDVETVRTETGTILPVTKGVDPAFAVTSTHVVYTVQGRGIFSTKLPSAP